MALAYAYVLPVASTVWVQHFIPTRLVEPATVVMELVLALQHLTHFEMWLFHHNSIPLFLFLCHAVRCPTISLPPSTKMTGVFVHYFRIITTVISISRWLDSITCAQMYCVDGMPFIIFGWRFVFTGSQPENVCQGLQTLHSWRKKAHIHIPERPKCHSFFLIYSPMCHYILIGLFVVSSLSLSFFLSRRDR